MWINTILAEIERMEPDDGTTLQLEAVGDRDEIIGQVSPEARRFSSYLNELQRAIAAKRKQRDETDSRRAATGYHDQIMALEEIFEIIQRIWWKEIRNSCPGNLGHTMLTLRKDFIIVRERGPENVRQ